MKRLNLITLLACLLAGLAQLAMAFSYSYNGVTFKCKVEGGGVCITSFDNKADVVTIPAIVYDGTKMYHVKSVSTFLNGNNYAATSLTLEEGIENIEKFSFNEFRKLRMVVLPSTVKHIGKNAFRDNDGMQILASENVDLAALRNGDELYIRELTEAEKEQRRLLAQRIAEQEAEQARLRAEREAEQARLRAEKEQEELRKQAEKEALAQQKQAEKEAMVAQILAEKEAERLLKEQEKAAKAQQGGGIKGMLLGRIGKKQNAASGGAVVAQNPVQAAPAQVVPAQAAPAQVASAQAAQPAAQAQPAVALADIDVNIPSGSAKDAENTFCVIIANEKYRDVPEVEFAVHDGEIFKQYLTQTLGIPEEQVRTFLNASFTDMKRALGWMENMGKATGGKARLVLYYAGHGVPNEQDNSAYLIPADGFPKDVETCFRLADVYARLSKMQAQSVTVFLDACFSGVKRGEGSALIASRGVAVKAKKEALSGNLVVFSAASEDETAYSYKEKGHGMFTYFLLKKLRDSKGEASLGELFDAVSSNVMKNSMLKNDKLQTPSVSFSASMKDKWKDIQF